MRDRIVNLAMSAVVAFGLTVVGYSIGHAQIPVLSPVDIQTATTINIHGTIIATIIPGQRVTIDAPAALITTRPGFIPGHTEIEIDTRHHSVSAQGPKN